MTEHDTDTESDSDESSEQPDLDPGAISEGDRVRAAATVTVTGDVHNIEQHPDDACVSIIDEDGDTVRFFYGAENDGWDIEGLDATVRVIDEDHSEDDTDTHAEHADESGDHR